MATTVAAVSAAATERKPALPALTGIRTFLAVGIMLFHFTPPHISWIQPLVGAGFTYIGFFLLISGFILAYNYAHRAHTLKPLQFYAARGARLYPVYLLSLVVSLGMLMLEWKARSHAEFWQGLVLTPILLQSWSPSLATFWNTVAWTLSAEAMLYLAFPHFIRMKFWPTEPAKLLRLFFVFWACELAMPVAYFLLNPDGLHNIDRYSSGYWLRALKYTPLPYVPVFLAGITLGRFHAAVQASDRAKMWCAAVASALILVVYYTAVPHLPYILLHGGLLTPVFALLVFGLTGTHWVSSIFSVGPLAAFGRASFCLYLLHFNLWMLIHDHHLPERWHFQAVDPWLSYVFILLVSYAAFIWVERPAQSYLLSRYVYAQKPAAKPRPQAWP